MKHPRLHQVKASAGSGKTFALTRRFLALLSGAVEFADVPGGGPDSALLASACANLRPKGYSWPEILAVTFTNKAATEMKERLVGALKARALGREVAQMDDAWTPAQAEHRLLAILSRYQRLNIRTIDSLLHLLLSIFALEAGLPPDFELIFEEDDLLALALDRHLARCESGADPEDHAAAEQLDAALRTLMEVQAASGFWLADGFKKRLQHLVAHLAAERMRGTGNLDLDTDQNRLAALLNASAQSLAQAATDMLAALEDEGLSANANFPKFLSRCLECGPFDPPPSSKFAEKDCLDECLNKASKGRASDRAETLFARLRQATADRLREYALLHSAYLLAPSTALALDLLRDMDRLALDQAAIPCSALPGLVHGLLVGEGWGGAPEAFCRLGDRLHHLLVDEFQDTGRDQWAAMTPLAEECLSKGGSLFYVGDVKQAIYGWRGGDASLFDQVAGLPGPDGTRLSDMAEPVADSLPCNWRSQAEVVGFNNDFFTQVAARADDLAESLLPEADPDLRHGLAADLNRAFADAAQDMPPQDTSQDGDQDRSGGYVRFDRLPGGSKEVQAAQSLEALVRLVTEELAARRPLSEIAVLVRTGAQAELVCTALIEAGVEVVTEKSLEIARHPVIRQLTALLSWLDFPEDDLALAEFLCGQEVFLPEAGLERTAMLDWLAGPGSKSERKGPLWRAFRKDFPKAWTLLDKLMNKAGMAAPYDLLSRAVARFRVLANNPAAELPVRRFLELVHQAGEHGHGSLTGFLAFWKEHGGEEKAPLPENMNAVRILTMHKAKGLEFPVVVVPFQHWASRPWNEFAVAEHAGSRYLVALRSGLGRQWDQRLADNALEQMHLLYVAWTRAKEELYGFIPDQVNGPRGAALAAMDLLLGPGDEDGRVEFGVRPEPPATPLSPEPQPAPVVVSGAEPEPELPRLRVYSHMDECAADERMRARLRGDAAHKAMELLRPPEAADATEDDDQAEARRAALAALHAFPVLDNLAEAERQTLLDDLSAMAVWALSQPELRPALHRGRFEATILTTDQEALRPDLIHDGDGGLLVVDFKTGEPDRKHPNQVRGYMDLLAAMGKGPVRGMLAYLDQRRLEMVGLESAGDSA